MPVKNYFLDTKKKEKLEVSWKRNYRHCIVRFNGEEVISINSRKEFREGKEVGLDYKTVLKIQLKKSMLFFTAIDLTVNERPVPGSMADPVKQINGIHGLILFIAFVNLVFGAVSVIYSPRLLTEVGIGWYTLVYGGIFLILGFMVKRFSQVAMILTIILMSLDIISTFIMSFEGSTIVNPASYLPVKVIFLFFILRGIPAINRMKQLNDMEEKYQKELEEKSKEIPRSKQITQDHSRYMPDDHSDFLPGKG